jgi:hypothetical protein
MTDAVETVERPLHRVLVNSNLKLDGTHYPAGVAIDIDDATLAKIPAGVVTPLRPVPLFVPPPKSAKLTETPAPAGKPQVVALNDDGPTFEEYVDAGYDKATYPPDGYAAKDSAAWRAYLASLQVEQKPAEAPAAPGAAPWQPNFQPRVREMK